MISFTRLQSYYTNLPLNHETAKFLINISVDSGGHCLHSFQDVAPSHSGRPQIPRHLRQGGLAYRIDVSFSPI